MEFIFYFRPSCDNLKCGTLCVLLQILMSVKTLLTVPIKQLARTILDLSPARAMKAFRVMA